MYPAALTGTYAEASDQGSQSAAGALIPQRALVSSRGSPPRGRHHPSMGPASPVSSSVEPKNLWW